MNRTVRYVVPTMLFVVACMQPTENGAPGIFAAKAPADPTVLAANPSFGYEGETGKVVTITGSGFDAGSSASWERNGVPDPKITVSSTQFVSAGELRATITIAPDATIAFYDVAVTTSRGRKGIGTERFEVTTATVIPGAARAYAVNDQGQVTGADATGRAYVFSESSGLEAFGPLDFMGRGISADGQTVVASHNRSRETDLAVVFVKSGGTWTQGTLPMGTGAQSSGANGMASDLSTGVATRIAGWVSVPGVGKKPTAHMEPRVWVNGSGGWQILSLPVSAAGPAGQAWSVGSSGVVGGATNGQAAVWDPNGSGGYTLTVLGPSGSRIEGINNAGTMAVGTNGTTGAYWWRTNTAAAWTGPTAFPGGCSIGHAVDDLGRIVGLCPRGSSSQPAVLLPPYSSASILFIGGLGNKDGANPLAISSSGFYVAGLGGGTGSGTPGGSLQAVYWKPF